MHCSPEQTQGEEATGLRVPGGAVTAAELLMLWQDAIRVIDGNGTEGPSTECLVGYVEVFAAKGRYDE